MDNPIGVPVSRAHEEGVPGVLHIDAEDEFDTDREAAEVYHRPNILIGGNEARRPWGEKVELRGVRSGRR